MTNYDDDAFLSALARVDDLRRAAVSHRAARSLRAPLPPEPRRRRASRAVAARVANALDAASRALRRYSGDATEETPPTRRLGAL